jgi:hypothetical protein
MASDAAIPMFNSEGTGMMNPLHWVSSVTSLDCDYGSWSSRDPSIGVLTTCGTTQATVALRISDCDKTVILPPQCNNAVWKLVTKDAYSEVWLDSTANMIWSDLAKNGGDAEDLLYANWCNASGASNTVVDSPYLSADTFISVYFEGSICDLNIHSTCFEADGYNSAYYSNAKGGLSATHGVIWYLPTVSDMQIAAANGIRRIVPNASEECFTSSVNSTLPDMAWSFGGGGSFYPSSYYRFEVARARCVAAAP